MLRNEHEDESQHAPVLPAGQRRVTPEELNDALAALESSKQEQARQIQQTVAIGDVVSELGLNVTPEEVWQQVQAQRAQTPAAPPPVASLADTVNETLHTAAQHAHKVAGQASAAAAASLVAARIARPQRQAGRRGSLGAFGIVIALAVGGAAWFNAGNGLMVNGDNETATYTGYHRAAVVNGDHETITLRGDCGSLVVNGDHDRVIVLGTVQRIVADGKGNTITWTQENKAQSPTIVDNGDGNHITRADSETLPPVSLPPVHIPPMDIPPLPDAPPAPRSH